MASAEVSGQPNAFYRYTLIYKRLTGTIFDLLDLVGGIEILETCDAPGCMTDPSDLNVSVVAGCGSCAADSRCGMDQTGQRPVMFCLETIQIGRQRDDHMGLSQPDLLTCQIAL